MAVEHDVDGLLLVVLVAHEGTSVAALLAVEEIGGAVPYVAQGIDVERLLESVFLDGQLTVLGCGVAYLGIADTQLLEVGLHLILVLVGHLDDHTGILGHENLHYVAVDVVQVDVYAAGSVGEGHLQQCGDQAAGADVVACHDPTAADEVLHRFETFGEVVGVGHRGHIVAHLA